MQTYNQFFNIKLADVKKEITAMRRERLGESTPDDIHSMPKTKPF